MATKHQVVAVSSICVAFIAVSAIIADPPAGGDDSGTAVYNGVNQLRRSCGTISNDTRLTAAAQRHANDMLKNGVAGHSGTDGSSPQARIIQAGYSQTGRTGEIVYWGTGVLATPAAALDAWMNSPPHRAIMLDCAFMAGGFATASDGNKMTAVGDFARP